MARFSRWRSKRPGTSPGALVHTGEIKTEQVAITVMDYDEAECHERFVEAVQECLPFKETPTTIWINVDGLHEVGVIEALGSHIGLHPLVMEDILNTAQRPKVEDYGDHIFIVLRMFRTHEEGSEIEDEQVSLILGPNYVLSFQERPGDVFDPVRERIRAGKGRIRKMGPAYLAYALVDTLVDGYFVVLERFGDRVEQLSEGLAEDPSPEVLERIHALRRSLIFVRKSVWPLREVIGTLERGSPRSSAERSGSFCATCTITPFRSSTR